MAPMKLLHDCPEISIALSRPLRGARVSGNELVAEIQVQYIKRIGIRYELYRQRKCMRRIAETEVSSCKLRQ